MIHRKYVLMFICIPWKVDIITIFASLKIWVIWLPYDQEPRWIIMTNHRMNCDLAPLLQIWVNFNASMDR